LHLSPTYAVITNIDPEHLDHYGSLPAIQEAFVEFANKVPFYGLVVACLDHPNVQAILPHIGKRVVTYGFSSQADYRAADIEYGATDLRFKVLHHGRPLGGLHLNMIGQHNVLNSLAVAALADEIPVAFTTVQEAFEQFQGVQRRFTVRGQLRGITVVDDYGHHPEEIKTTLDGAKRAHHRRTVVVFQPHRYTRTRDLAEAFATAFNNADLLAIMDIYAAGEDPIPGVTAAGLLERIRAAGHHHAKGFSDRQQLVDWLLTEVQPGDLLITMGAGDVWKVGEAVLKRLAGEPGRSK
jgi:UDP-N-acetylmuramate--alanine ligase